MTTPVDATGYTPEPVRDTSGIAGHPRGLSTLFFTELWERFSFYGLKAILFLYMTKMLAEGGLQLPGPYAGLIMATYASSVYWTPLVGGWVADKWLGAKRSVLVGGIIIACGHFSMAIDTITTFYAGLALIAIGTGFLKPNVSTMVGDLYDEEDDRRDAGFSIFYMGINLGAVLAPLVVGSIAQSDFVKHILTGMGFNPIKSWHWAFSAAGFFMLIGLVQYVAGGKRLKGIGEMKVSPRATDISEVARAGGEVQAAGTDILTIALSVVGGVFGFLGGLKWGGAGWVGGLFPAVLFFFLGYILGTVRGLERSDVLRVSVIGILITFSAIFWMSFEQASTSLTLFADRLTHLYIFGYEFKSSFYQSVEPIFVVSLAPVFAIIWMRLGRRNPSSPAKFAMGLFFAAVAFAILAYVSTTISLTGGEIAESQKVSPLWLVIVYFLQSLGELSISPVGLSTVSKLAPAKLLGLMMGVWFLSISIGDFVAGIMGGQFDEKKEGALFRSFGGVALITIIATIILVALIPVIKRMTPSHSSAETAA